MRKGVETRVHISFYGYGYEYGYYNSYIPYQIIRACKEAHYNALRTSGVDILLTYTLVSFLPHPLINLDVKNAPSVPVYSKVYRN